jgi:hypothetical protein
MCVYPLLPCHMALSIWDLENPIGPTMVCLYGSALEGIISCFHHFVLSAFGSTSNPPNGFCLQSPLLRALLSKNTCSKFLQELCFLKCLPFVEERLCTEGALQLHKFLIFDHLQKFHESKPGSSPFDRTADTAGYNAQPLKSIQNLCSP